MKRDRYLLLTILCAALIAVPAFGIFIFQGNGFFTVVDDFNTQQIPFSAAAWEGIHSGGGDWYWGLDLGSSFVNAFGFYNLGSPFFWLYLLLPKASFPFAVGWLYILKYVAAGIAAYFYLGRFVQKKTAVIGALLYAFSGFQTTNLEFYHFHDAVAFFPLLLIGAEQMMEEKNPLLFVFSVFLNCLVNYFFFIQEVIFLIFYFLFRVSSRETARNVVLEGLRFLIYGVLGAGMAAVLFIPGALYALGNSRGHPQLVLSDFFFDSAGLLHVLKGILLPGDTMTSSSAVIWQSWDSAACYLPLFGLGFVFAYLMRKKSDWLKSLLALLLVFCLTQVTNSLFLLFTAVYMRWWYMLVLMMVLATAKVMDQPENYPVNKGVLLYLGITTVFFLCVRYLPWNDYTGPRVYAPRRFLLFFLIAAGGTGVTLLALKFRNAEYPILLVSTCVWCLITTMMTLQYYREYNGEETRIETRKNWYASMQMHDLDGQYRYNSISNGLLIPNNTGGVGAFTSTAENSSYVFSRLFDQESRVFTSSRCTVPYVSQLTGGKYNVIDSTETENSLYAAGYPGGTYMIIEGTACPIGFWVDQYLTEDELMSLPPENRAVALMNAVLVDEKDVDMVSKDLSTVSAVQVGYGNPDESIRRTTERAVEGFERDARGFRCQTDWEETRYVYFTVPYDRGWSALIDNSPADILCSGGMMAIRIPAGEHAIDFVYNTPGLREGKIISICSFAVFAAMLFVSVRRRHGGR